MQSVLLAGPQPSNGGDEMRRSGAVALVERDLVPLAAGEVRLAVEMCGLCGTDFAACRFDADGRSHFSGPLRLPVVLGHEVAGTVEAVGPGVRRVRAGDLVAVESVLSCWTCDTCLGGSPAQCERGELLGLTRDGGLAERVAVPERACFPLDALLRRGLSRAETAVAGALIEPLGAVYSALFLAGRPALPGEAVVVYGLGGLGLLVGTLARLAGCSPVVGVDRDPARVAGALARGFDAAVAIDLEPAGAAAAAREIGGRLHRRGAEVQVDVSGTSDAVLPVAQRLLAPAGRLVVLSRSRRAVALEVDPWVSAAASLHGTRGRTDARAFTRLVALFADGRLRARELVARFVPLAEVPAILVAGSGAPTGKIVAAIGAAPPW